MASYAAGPHVHGTATMQIAIEGNNVEVALIAPLESLLGFERAPRNDKERQAVQMMMKQLSDPSALLIPTAAARCTPAKPQITAPALDARMKVSDNEKHDEADNHGRHDEAHAELEAVISFRCAVPAALNSMEVRLFDVFPRLQKLKAEVAASGKQSAANLGRERRTLFW